MTTPRRIARMLALTSSLLLTLGLTLARADVPPELIEDGFDDSNPQSAYEQALNGLELARVDANSKVDEGVLANLARAILELETFTEALSDDEEGRSALSEAKLVLARDYAKLGDQAAAERVLDDLLRSTPDLDTIPIASFGRKMIALFDARKALMDETGKATLQIRCSLECEVSVDTQPVVPGDYDLYVGAHVVWFRSLDGRVPSSVKTLDLAAAGATLEVGLPDVIGDSIADSGSESDTESSSELDADSDSDSGSDRAEVSDSKSPIELPPKPPARRGRLGLEIAGTLVGAGQIVAGSVLLGLDGRCADGSPNLLTCPKVHQSLIGGAVLVSIGTALITTIVGLQLHRPRHKEPTRVAFDRHGNIHF